MPRGFQVPYAINFGDNRLVFAQVIKGTFWFCGVNFLNLGCVRLRQGSDKALVMEGKIRLENTT